MKIESDHTYLFVLQLRNGLQGVRFKHEWNYAEVTYENYSMRLLFKEIRFHIFRQESSMEDIQLTSPYKKREVD